MYKYKKSNLGFSKYKAVLPAALLLVGGSLAGISQAAIKILRADFRERPPEMVRNGVDLQGPLRDILDEAASQLGYQVKWQFTPFSQSLKRLRNGTVDLVPRTIRKDDRETYINFIGPIGFQQKDIVFLVRKGQENRINRFEDLYNLKIGFKRKTAYFKEFDTSNRIKKSSYRDDTQLAQKFVNQQFDAIIVLDKASLEKQLGLLGYSNYSYANYRYQQDIGNYYGMSKYSPHKKLYEKLSEVMTTMATNGRVAEIYRKYKLTPPLIH
ncbi:substrate-binding periplasmic protein [Spartinivicinus ruber]|uniref:substrate-binding periplasmic protein n=1 Tax=Spartinivicinus ruber TaxID=2683272 RepID=UPI0013D23AA6|nr:transporter substrate-binding domain-containing protein [Spartinivicinus ruber]